MRSRSQQSVDQPVDAVRGERNDAGRDAMDIGPGCRPGDRARRSRPPRSAGAIEGAIGGRTVDDLSEPRVQNSHRGTRVRELRLVRRCGFRPPADRGGFSGREGRFYDEVLSVLAAGGVAAGVFGSGQAGADGSCGAPAARRSRRRERGAAGRGSGCGAGPAAHAAIGGGRLRLPVLLRLFRDRRSGPSLPALVGPGGTAAAGCGTGVGGQGLLPHRAGRGDSRAHQHRGCSCRRPERA